MSCIEMVASWQCGEKCTVYMRDPLLLNLMWALLNIKPHSQGFRHVGPAKYKAPFPGFQTFTLIYFEQTQHLLKGKR